MSSVVMAVTMEGKYQKISEMMVLHSALVMIVHCNVSWFFKENTFFNIINRC